MCIIMKKIQIISLRVIALFVIAMFVSFIPEYLHDFFGDTYCKIQHHMYAGNYHDHPENHWGYRHWLFFIMGVILFIIQAFDIIVYIDND